MSTRTRHRPRWVLLIVALVSLVVGGSLIAGTVQAQDAPPDTTAAEPAPTDPATTVTEEQTADASDATAQEDQQATDTTAAPVPVLDSTGTPPDTAVAAPPAPAAAEPAPVDDATVEVTVTDTAVPVAPVEEGNVIEQAAEVVANLIVPGLGGCNPDTDPGRDGPCTVNPRWLLPPGGTPENGKIWPQTYAPREAECGEIIQIDTWFIDSRADWDLWQRLVNGGKMNQGDDSSIFAGNDWDYGDPCPPPPTKINICHRDQGNPEWKVIPIDESALAAHLTHQWGADMYPVPEGGCPPLECPPGTTHVDKDGNGKVNFETLETECGPAAQPVADVSGCVNAAGVFEGTFTGSAGSDEANAFYGKAFASAIIDDDGVIIDGSGTSLFLGEEQNLPFTRALSVPNAVPFVGLTLFVEVLPFGIDLKGTANVKVDHCVPPPVDVCPNIDGMQTTVPDGMVKDAAGNCVTPPPPPVDVCPNVPGNQTTTDECPPPVDVCPNIDGMQTTVPDGMVKDAAGNCVTPPPPPVDVCPNIEGMQASVPTGYVVDSSGNCVPLCPRGTHHAGQPHVDRDGNGKVEAKDCDKPPTVHVGRPNTGWDPGSEVDQRLIGLGLVLFGFALIILHFRLRRREMLVVVD